MNRHILSLRAMVILGSAATVALAADPARVDTSLLDRDGNVIGKVSAEPSADGVRIEVHAEGLDPGVHAVHLHQRGVCQAPDFKSAGDHYNPAGARHGMPDGDPRLDVQDHHAGDMPNQMVDDKGVLDAVIINASVNLTDGRNVLLDDDGAALVVHSGADDYHTQPAGDAGDRVACAVLERRS